MTTTGNTDVSVRAAATRPFDYAGQVVLVLQGGGALGAYQAGVYEALHEAGIEPDWVIGTSIGAINGAIIAGNAPGERMAKLKEFWNRVQGVQGQCTGPFSSAAWCANAFATPPTPWSTALANMNTYLRGINGFFKPNLHAAWGMNTPLGVDQAGFYSTAPLRQTLEELVDFDAVNTKRTRLTLGAVNVRSGEMRYFDSRDEALGPEHVMASGALPPAFPAVRIGDASYWDGGIYSNTPIEAVLDDKPRRDSLIFSANMWQPTDVEPETMAKVLARQKDIQYASRATSHIARQQQIHRLRHIIRDLAAHIAPDQRSDPAVRDLLAYGCATVMHVVPLLAPRIKGEDQTKDIDFTPPGVTARWRAGYDDMKQRLAEACWQNAFDAIDGVIVHDVQVHGSEQEQGKGDA